MRYSLFILLAIALSLPVFAQDYLLALRQSEAQSFIIINTNGDTLLTLPPGHEPAVLAQRDPIKLGNFYTLDRRAPAIAVYDGNSKHFLLNLEGDTIAQLPDNLNWVSPWQNGYFRVYEPFQGARNTSWVIYYDENGQPLFDGRRFWEGSPFQQGRAIVQLENRDGPWYLMDSLGLYQLTLSDSIEGLIRNYKWKEKGVWELSVKAVDSYRFSKTYLHPDGRMSSNESDLWPEGSRRQAGDLPDTGLSVHPHIKRRINQLPFMVFPEFYQTDTYGLYLLPDTTQGAPEHAHVLYDHLYRELTIPSPDTSEQLQPQRFMGRYLLVKKTSADGQASFVFVDTRDFSFGLELDQLPFGTRVDGDLLFFETDELFSRSTVHKIVRLDGKIIYDPNATQTLFRSMDAALAHADQAIEVQIDGTTVMDMLDLLKLPNLEVLKVKTIFGERLPTGVFDKLPKLRVLHLQYAKDLKALPEELKAASALTYLRLSDCPQLANPTDLLLQLPALSHLHTDYPFTQAQRQALQQAHPGLVLEEMLQVVPE